MSDPVFIAWPAEQGADETAARAGDALMPASCDKLRAASSAPGTEAAAP